MANLGPPLVVTLEADIARYTANMGRAAQQTAQEMGRIDRASAQTQRAMETLQNSANFVRTAFIGMTAGLSVDKLVQYSDSWTNIDSRLKQVTGTSSELAAVQGQLFDISQRNRTDMSETVALYVRMAKSSDALGASQRDMIKFTQGVSAAVLLGGTSAEESAGALQQLSQALSNAKIQAEEYNSINDGAPEILRAVAKNIQGVDGDLGRLRQKMLDGGLTSKEFFAAFLKDADNLAEKTQGMTLTVAQAYTKLNNEAMKFVGEASKSSGAGQLLAGTIDGLSKNLNTLAAVAGGLVTFKVSEWALLIASSLVTKANAAYTAAGAITTERVATIAAAEAAAAGTAATVAEVEAKSALIAELRAEAIATVARTNAVIASTASDEANVLAMESRAVAMTELAALGRAQVAVQAEITASTAAATAAQTALTSATAAGIGGNRLASAALGFLGGPIGIITTVLGLGAAAWLYWGNSAKDAEAKSAKAVETSTEEILANLDAQIKKLRERNGLASSGLRSIAQSQTPESERLASLRAKMVEVSEGQGDYAGLPDAARNDLLAKLGAQYGTLYARIQDLNQERAKLAKSDDSAATAKWMKEYATKAEQLAEKLKEVRASYKDGVIPPEVEKRVRESFDPPSLNKSLLNGRLKGLEEVYAQERDTAAFHDEYMQELRNQDLVDVQTYAKYKVASIEQARDAAVRAYDGEIAALKKAHAAADDAAAKASIATQINEKVAARDVARADAVRALVLQTLSMSAAQSGLNRAMQDWNREQDQAESQLRFENDLYGKSALEVAKLTEARRLELDIEERIRQAKEKGTITEASIAQYRKDAADHAAKINSGATKSIGRQTIDSLKTPQEQENAQYANRLKDLQTYRDAEFANTVEADQAIEREKQRHAAAIAEMEAANHQQSLAMAGDAADQLYGLLQQSGREQSALAKAAFLASKAIAVAEIILNTEVAAAKAGAQLGIYGIPMAAMIKVTGYASAGMVAGMAIAGAREKGGPVWDGGAFLVGEKGPEIFRPPTHGTIIPNDKIGGAGGDLKLTIVNNTRAPIGNVTEHRISATERALIIEEAVNATASSLADPNSRTSRAMNRNYSVPRSRS